MKRIKVLLKEQSQCMRRERRENGYETTGLLEHTMMSVYQSNSLQTLVRDVEAQVVMFDERFLISKGKHRHAGEAIVEVGGNEWRCLIKKTGAMRR